MLGYIHPVFHVSQLQPMIGSSNIAILTLPLVDGNAIIYPEELHEDDEVAAAFTHVQIS
jgi:hypothetical protein